MTRFAPEVLDAAAATFAFGIPVVADPTVQPGVIYSIDVGGGPRQIVMHPDDLDRLRWSLEIREIVRDGMADVLRWLHAAGRRV